MKTGNKLLRSLLFLLLICALTLGTLSVQAEAELPCFSVTSGSGRPGEEITVQLVLTNNPGILNATLTLNYDPALVLTKVEKGEALSTLMLTYPGKLENGCNFLWDAMEAADTTNGTVLNLTFRLPEDGVDGTEYEVGFSYIHGDIADNDLQPVTCQMQAGTIKLQQYRYGDVNDDGRINGTDVTLVRRHIAGGWNVQIITEAADVNNDGRINGTDVTYIRRYIAGGWGVELPVGSKCTHTNMTATAEKAATCTEEGNIAYWYCGSCKKHFTDSKGKTEIALADTVTPAAGHGILTYNARKEPTCTDPGHVEYWYCGTCNGYYADEEGKTVIENVFLAAKDHAFSDAWVSDDTYHWHTAVCEHTDVISEKVRHTFENNVCTVCKYDASLRLDAPTNVHVADDVISWTAVPNAKTYTVVANDIYKITGFEGTECPVEFLTYKVGDTFKTISTHGIIRVKVMAEEAGSYKASEWSALCNDYYYIPDSTNQDDIKALQKYGLGRAYNFVEDYYIDNEQISSYAVLDPAKLLTIGSYTDAPNTKGFSDYYTYSSIDEYMSKREDSLNTSVGVDIPLAGSLEIQLGAVVTSQYEKYAYNEMFIAEVGVTLEDHKIIGLSVGENGADNDALIACMDKAFLADITGKTTNGLSNEELAAWLYNKYGTHVILGVTTGGSYLAQYTISTNDEAVADTVEQNFKLDGGIDVKEIVKVDIGIENRSMEETSWSNSTTEAHFNVTWIGSNQGATVNPAGLDDAISKFSAGVTKDTAHTVRLANSDGNQTPSAIAISDLIWAVDPELAEAFEKYISDCADDSYEEMYKKYESSFVRMVGAPTVENGKNVLTVDLSVYQKGGSLESAYDPNFIDGVLKLHPVMYTKRIDKIVLRGAFDEADKRNLIDSITVALPKEWNGRTLEIVIENLGAVATAECGILDLSAISNDAGISVSYSGINVIRGTDGLYTCYADGKAFALELKADETIDFSTASVSGGVTLPVATKANYDFAGWIDGDGNMVAASNGKLNADVQFGTDVPLLSATWKPVTYKLTLNEQGATQSGTKQLYQLYGISYTLEYSETEDIAKQNAVSKITVPVKTGYVFGGYYSVAPENNSTVNVKEQGEKYIDASGNIVVSNMTLTAAKTVYAKWTPAAYTVVYDRNGATEGSMTASVHRYGVEAKLTAVGFKKEAASFGGWNTKADGTGTTYTNEATVKNLTSADGGVVTLYAMWTNNIIVTLNAPDATNNYTKNVYMTPAKDAFYGDVNCTEKLEVISKPALTGYSFGGFYDSVENNKTYNPTGTNLRIDKEGKFVSIPENDYELEALWDLDEFTASWNAGVNCNIVVKRTSSPLANAATGTITSGTTVYYGDLLTITYTAHTGYEFTSTSKGKTSVFVTGKVTSSDIYASAKAKTFTVTYDLNKASSDTSSTSKACYEDLSFSKSTYTVTYNASYTLDVPTAKYYTFKGWYTSGGAQITNEKGVSLSKWTNTSGITVYAHWTKTNPEYTYVKTTGDFTKISGNLSGQYLLIDDIVWPGGAMFESFSGTLDGGGHTISGIKFSLSDGQDANVGMFKQINSGASVKNINFTSCSAGYAPSAGYATYEIYFGFVAPFNYGTISNCTFTGNAINIDNNSKVSDQFLYAGIVTACNYGYIVDCTIKGNSINLDADTVDSSNDDDRHTVAVAGGACAYNYSGASVINCVATGNTIKTRACYFTQDDTAESLASTAGGLIGYQLGTVSGNSASGNTLTASYREYYTKWEWFQTNWYYSDSNGKTGTIYGATSDYLHHH